MKDFRKFCRPKIKSHPEAGDVLIKLKCGTIGAMSPEEYKKVKKFFKSNSFVGESPSSVGKVITINKITGDTAVFDIETYNLVKDLFEIQEVIGEKNNPFNQHEYVDFGLPSGTLWATMNVGASSETETGTFYKFGETTAYDGTDYNTSTYTDETTAKLPLENDAANVNWGGDWYIPTKTLWNELIESTTHTIISDYNSTGIDVIKFTKTNDSSTFIVLPMIGSYTDGELHNPTVAYYWASSQRNGSADYALFSSSYTNPSWTTAYGHGMLVRAVCDSINSQGTVSIGDIICYNSELDRQAIFSYEDWITLDDSWDAIRLYGIETFDDDDEVTEERKVIMSNGTTFIIKSTDYSSVSSHWEVVDTISVPGPPTIDGHEYVEIGGIKWATMNIGASSVTDYGLYFQWGDTQGYTAAEVGCENGKKCFDSDTWSDYKYGLIDLDDEDNYGMTKYNSTDGKTVLEASDDAAQANWGGQWRMPTTDECVALGEAVTTAWTNDYQSTGVKGLVCTSKADGATLFFPAAGYCEDGAVSNVGSNGNYWSSSLNNGDAYYARYLYFNSVRMNNIYYGRNRGFSVRGVVDSN